MRLDVAPTIPYLGRSSDVFSTFSRRFLNVSDRLRPRVCRLVPPRPCNSANQSRERFQKHVEKTFVEKLRKCSCRSPQPKKRFRTILGNSDGSCQNAQRFLNVFATPPGPRNTGNGGKQRGHLTFAKPRPFLPPPPSRPNKTSRKTLGTFSQRLDNPENNQTSKKR